MGGSGHFEIFASKAYACVPGVKRQELDATSAKGIFTGRMIEEIMILWQRMYLLQEVHMLLKHLPITLPIMDVWWNITISLRGRGWGSFEETPEMSWLMMFHDRRCCYYSQAPFVVLIPSSLAPPYPSLSYGWEPETDLLADSMSLAGDRNYESRSGWLAGRMGWIWKRDTDLS